MTALFAALVTFSAFGAAILAFLTAGGGLDSVADYWIEHARQEAARERKQGARWRPEARKQLVRWVSGTTVALIQIFSGLGLVACGVWFVATVAKRTGWPESMYWLTVATFGLDALLITGLTTVAVILAGVLPALEGRGNQISFEVQGYPPTADQQGAAHGERENNTQHVLTLLEAARQACRKQAFTPIGNGNVALAVVLRWPADQDGPDAATYLDGISKLLANSFPRDAYGELGELATVWLYQDFRQLTEITYSEAESDHASYTITVRAAGKQPARQ